MALFGINRVLLGVSKLQQTSRVQSHILCAHVRVRVRVCVYVCVCVCMCVRKLSG